jgi:hypothetical protein
MVRAVERCPAQLGWAENVAEEEAKETGDPVHETGEHVLRISASGHEISM